MKVGLVTTPLTSGHAVRGVGFYTKLLLQRLKVQAPRHNIEILEIRNNLEMSNSKLDVIHYPFFDLFWHTLPISSEAKRVVTVHDVIPLEFTQNYPPGLRGWANLQLQKLALSRVERVISDSYSSIKSISKLLAVSHSKLRLVYLAADEKFKPIARSKLGPIRRKYSLPTKFVLYVGDVNWNKNIPGLVKGCKLAKLPLVMVGKQATEVEWMNLNHLQLEHLKNLDWDGVLRLGFVPDDDLVAIYNLATVYCQPSFAEGFGLGVLEALSCSTAVACSRTHSLPEVAGDAATYFDPHNPAQIAKALQAGKTGKEISQAAKFSWDKTASETIAVYKEVV